jgi:hypothetical protein
MALPISTDNTGEDQDQQELTLDEISNRFSYQYMFEQ